MQVNLKKRLGDFNIDVAFDMPPGGITALFGRSGSGKTTLVNMMAGLLRPDSGVLSIAGQTLFDSDHGVNVKPEHRRVGYVFQEGRLFPHLSVKSNLYYGRRFAPKGGRYVDAGQIIELLGLNSLLARRPATLSGGEKQRVAIGRALLSEPRLLLMDEPLAALDAARKSEIMRHIERLRDEVGVPIVYVSHALDDWDDSLRRAVHVVTAVVNAGQHHLDPGFVSGDFEGAQVVAGNAVGADLPRRLGSR